MATRLFDPEEPLDLIASNSNVVRPAGAQRQPTQCFWLDPVRCAQAEINLRRLASY
jgi:hypothetical protein